MNADDRAALRVKADAARIQIENGPKEWPGRPSRQRLELFLATGPYEVLDMLDHIDRLEESGENADHH